MCSSTTRMYLPTVSTQHYSNKELYGESLFLRLWQPTQLRIPCEQVCIPVGCVPTACSPYPSMHCAGGVYPSMHSAGGMCIQACTGQGTRGRHTPWEQRQTPPLHGTRGRHPPWTKWQTGVKTLPCRNFVGAVINTNLKFETYLTRASINFIRTSRTLGNYNGDENITTRI